MSVMALCSSAPRFLAVAVLGSVVALAGCNGDVNKKSTPSKQEEAIAVKACQLTTQLMQRGEGGYRECIKVDLDRKVTDTFYQAHAILENGEEQPMGIRLADKDSEDVTVTLRSGW